MRGSEWYANNPIAPLSEIKYLINLDMINDNNPDLYCEVSAEGMEGYTLFEEINTDKGYFKALDRAELADNSDHYPFAVRGVPCIFFMNEDDDAFKYYHTVYDTYENTIFDSYEPIFEFLVEFIENHQYDK